MNRRGLLTLPLVAALLTGCITGTRGHFEAATSTTSGSTNDSAIDAVLAKLEAVTPGPATAAYNVLTKFGNTTAPATVVLSPGKRAITIKNVRYLDIDGVQRTCSTDSAVPCTDGLLIQRTSDVAATLDFYAADAAKRLRRDAAAKIGPTRAHQETFASMPASCVDVPVDKGTAVYCVLDNGMIAKLDDGDVLVLLTLFANTADPAVLTLPGA